MTKPIQEQIVQAVQKLKEDDVIGLPTETVYGLAADIRSEKALKKIFSTKQRPFFDPLIVHVSSIEQAQACVKVWPIWAQVLAEKFWPGPMTLVLEKNNTISDVITSGLNTVGLRWPRHEVAQKIIEQLGSPVAAPSANKFGQTSPTTAEHVRSEFNNEVFVVDSNPSEIGIESTIVLIRLGVAPRNQQALMMDGSRAQAAISILRKGWITRQDVEKALAQLADWHWDDSVQKPMAPGQMKHHYMPSLPLVLVKPTPSHLSEEAILKWVNEKIQTLPDEVEGVKIKKPSVAIKKPIHFDLGTDAQLAARRLYAGLRACDQSQGDMILCRLGPEMSGEVWESILDRLYKAASLILD